jgi:hypothetical protein
MNSTLRTVEDLILTINQETFVNASLEVTFDALLEQIGPRNERADGVPMPMVIEPWPGGRWYRDLGDGNGHFGLMCRPSSGPRCLSLPARSSPRIRLFRTCNTGSVKRTALHGLRFVTARWDSFRTITAAESARAGRRCWSGPARPPRRGKPENPGLKKNVAKRRMSQCAQFAWRRRRGLPQRQSQPEA